MQRELALINASISSLDEAAAALHLTPHTPPCAALQTLILHGNRITTLSCPPPPAAPLPPVPEPVLQ